MIIRFFKNRSIIFYIFWLSLLIGEISLQLLFKVKGCIALPSAKDSYFLPNVPQCDLIEIIFIYACIFIFIFSITAYLIRYLFKCLKCILKLIFNLNDFIMRF